MATCSACGCEFVPSSKNRDSQYCKECAALVLGEEQAASASNVKRAAVRAASGVPMAAKKTPVGSSVGAAVSQDEWFSQARNRNVPAMEASDFELENSDEDDGAQTVVHSPEPARPSQKSNAKMNVPRPSGRMAAVPKAPVKVQAAPPPAPPPPATQEEIEEIESDLQSELDDVQEKTSAPKRSGILQRSQKKIVLKKKPVSARVPAVEAPAETDEGGEENADDLALVAPEPSSNKMTSRKLARATGRGTSMRKVREESRGAKSSSADNGMMNLIMGAGGGLLLGLMIGYFAGHSGGSSSSDSSAKIENTSNASSSDLASRAKSREASNDSVGAANLYMLAGQAADREGNKSASEKYTLKSEQVRKAATLDSVGGRR